MPFELNWQQKRMQPRDSQELVRSARRQQISKAPPVAPLNARIELFVGGRLRG